MVGHVNNDNNNGGPGGNLPALKGVASMSSANYLRKSVSCQRIDEIFERLDGYAFTIATDL